MSQTITANLAYRATAEAADIGAVTDAFQLTDEENRVLMHLVCRNRTIRRHVELFQMMRGEVQALLPHQILISAWGDFGSANLHLDVISALPGVRTSQLAGCDVGDMLRSLHARWLRGARQAILLEGATAARLLPADCRCALHRHLRGMRSLLVHGVHCARDGTDTLYVAAHDGALSRECSVDRYGRLMDLVIAQIDIAFRRVAGFKAPGAADIRIVRPSGGLSRREEEILALVSRGRTNLEIAQRLGISGYTVKNHVQRINRKLGAANRTEAAAMYRLREPERRGLREVTAAAAAAPASE